MEVAILNTSGKETGKKIKLSQDVFGVEPNDHAIYLDVKQFLANQRQGTHKSKERNEVSGSTKKIKRQKGTGGARAGSIKSPLFVGGGRIFGPQPRDYSFKLNKKVKQLAKKSALAYKAKANNITVIEDFSFDAPKTKKYAELLGNLNMDGQKTLLVLNQPNQNLVLSVRNIQDSHVITANNLNTYDILNADNLVLVESSVEVINNTF